MADYETMLLEVTDHVATVTINRPEARNALNRKAYTELENIFRDLQQDADVRCIILTGTDPAFCSGDDVKELMTGDTATTHARLRQVRPGTTPAATAILDCDRPVIAAVNGAAVEAMRTVINTVGMDGIVASPAEATTIRRIAGPAIAIVTPGIRPAGADTGDQRRVATPATAIRAGADYLVVGRPINAAADPKAAADSIVAEIETAITGKGEA